MVGTLIYQFGTIGEDTFEAMAAQSNGDVI